MQTGLEWLYCDTRKLNHKSFIQIKRPVTRLLLNQDESELTYRFFQTQIVSNSEGDLVRLAQSDESELDINLTDKIFFKIMCLTSNFFLQN